MVPLALLIMLRAPTTWMQGLQVALGAVLGAIPAAFNFFFPQTVNTWDPSHPPVINPDLIISNLGLDGIPTYFAALLPYSLGLAPSESSQLSLIQSAITWLVIIAIGLSAAIGSAMAIRARCRPGPGTAIAVAWVGAISSIVAFGVVVDPVWFYGAGLAVLLWISLGVLPSVIRPRPLALTTTVLALGIIGLSTLTHNVYWWQKLPDRYLAKVEFLDSQQRIADQLRAFDVEFVYGSYYDVLPVVYGSAGDLYPVTSTYNRFPLDPTQVAGTERVVVAVDENPGGDVWAVDALTRVENDCTRNSTVSAGGDFGIYDCPVQLVLRPENP